MLGTDAAAEDDMAAVTLTERNGACMRESAERRGSEVCGGWPMRVSKARVRINEGTGNGGAAHRRGGS